MEGVVALGEVELALAPPLELRRLRWAA